MRGTRRPQGAGQDHRSFHGRADREAIQRAYPKLTGGAGAADRSITGRFTPDDLSAGDPAFAWADSRRLSGEAASIDFEQQSDLVLRADFYVGERDLFGIGFSGNVLF